MPPLDPTRIRCMPQKYGVRDKDMRTKWPKKEEHLSPTADATGPCINGAPGSAQLASSPGSAQLTS